MEWPADILEAARARAESARAMKIQRMRDADSLLCRGLRDVKPARVVGMDPRVFTTLAITIYCTCTPLERALSESNPVLARAMLETADQRLVRKHGGALLAALAVGGRRSASGRRDGHLALEMLLRCGVDPNTPMWNVSESPYAASFVGHVLRTGDRYSIPLLQMLLDDPRLDGRVWGGPSDPPISLERYVGAGQLPWAGPLLTEWGRWRARRAWVSAVLRAPARP